MKKKYLLVCVATGLLCVMMGACSNDHKSKLTDEEIAQFGHDSNINMQEVADKILTEGAKLTEAAKLTDAAKDVKKGTSNTLTPTTTPTITPTTTPTATPVPEPDFLEIMKLLPAGTQLETEGVPEADLGFGFYSEVPYEAFATRIKEAIKAVSTIKINEDVVLLRVLYYEADGKIYIGEMMAEKSLASDVLTMFRELFDKKTPMVIEAKNSGSESSVLLAQIKKNGLTAGTVKIDLNEYFVIFN